MPTLAYSFDLTQPHTHLVGVSLHLPAHPEASTDVFLPAWLPGAYKIFDNARNIRSLHAAGPDGAGLRVERVDWQTWRVHHGGAGAVISYDVYCNKPEIHQGQLDAEHGFLNPGVLALVPKGHQEDWPVTLTLRLPEGWRVATGLKAIGPDTFKAANYEELIDCPLQCGQFALATFDHDGVGYEVVYEGATPWDPAVMIGPLRRIITAASDLWGRPPLERYVFMYLETDAGYLNGLEHGNSTIITGPVTDPERWDGLLTISTHEFFHLWNVKRLRPVGFGPFDYTHEAHTTALWVAEGFTEYYTDVLMRWAGLRSPEAYLACVTQYLQQLHAMPGRHNMSLEEASWTTWHFGDDRWNGALNYYVKGYMLAVALDLTLRHRSEGAVSLDDVMRGMWREFGAPGINYRPEDVCEMAERLLGQSLEPFWAHHLRGRDDGDWQAIFQPAGLLLLERDPRPSLQVAVEPTEGGLRLTNVRAGGAAQAAGLQKGDVLVAVGGLRATAPLLEELGEHVEPGDVVEVHFFRRDMLRTLLVTMAREVSYVLMADPAAGASQVALRQAWLAPMPAKTAVRT
jgi:predicted metalloprotease with PDZ domain